MARSHGIGLKKRHGQHFLRDVQLLSKIPDYAKLNQTTNVLEIGCGDGALTQQLLRRDIKKLWVFEIDPEWVKLVEKQFPDSRLTIFQENILDVDFSRFVEHEPWTLVANLPYQIVFPLLYRLQKHRELFTEGVIMVQEEVAQKIVATHGRKYGFSSLFFQRYFTWKLLDKVPPDAFYPAPKVFSRLLHFDSISVPDPIEKEAEFWIFIRCLFSQPRRTIKNNLKSAHYPINLIPAEWLTLRAQQLSMHDFIAVWKKLCIAQSLDAVT